MKKLFLVVALLAVSGCGKDEWEQSSGICRQVDKRAKLVLCPIAGVGIAILSPQGQAFVDARGPAQPVLAPTPTPSPDAKNEKSKEKK